MSSEKNIGKRIADWFTDNTWVYSTVVTIGLALILAVVSINIGLGSSGGGNNMFNGGIDWEWSSEEDESWEDSSEMDSSIVKEDNSSQTSSSLDDTCNHEWVEVERKEATCTQSGYIKYICEVCEGKKSNYLRSQGHYFFNGKCIKCGEYEEE